MGWLDNIVRAAEQVAEDTLEDVDTIVDRWLDGDD